MVGGAGELRHRRHARMRDQAVEALRLRADPVGHVAAEAAAHRHDARRDRRRGAARPHRSRPSGLRSTACPRRCPRCPGRSPVRIRSSRADWAARRRSRRPRQQRIPAPVPGVGRHADRAAMDPQQHRQLALRLRRLGHEVLDRRAVGRRHRAVFDLDPVRERRSRTGAPAPAAASRAGFATAKASGGSRKVERMPTMRPSFSTRTSLCAPPLRATVMRSTLSLAMSMANTGT